MTDPSRQPTIAERLFEPGLVRRLSKSLLRRGVPSRAVDDVVQQARIEVWQRFASEAHAPDEVERLLFRVAQCRAIDWWRSERRQVLREDYEELVESRAHRPEAPAREALEAIERDVADDPQLAQALCDLADKEVGGEEYDDIGRRRGVHPGRVRKGVFRLRGHVHEHLADYRGLIALAVVALLVSLARQRHRDEPARDHEPRPVPTIVAPPKPAPEQTPAQRARELRGVAERAYRAGEYAACRRALDAARAIDEAGDAEPAVRALRAAAERGIDAEFTPDGKPRRR
jgi:DNA-directed RNA polymerase specialized sigma24 family protein